MEQRNFAGGIRSDDGRDLGRESNRDWLSAETAKACKGDVFETHDGLSR